jgi:7-cyano-7-deazaguanine synthase in queuosine biosynthesis
LLNSKKYYGDVYGVYAAHGDLSWGSHIVNDLLNKIKKVENDIDCSTLFAPEMGSRGYSQLRGFLYVLFGSIYVSLLNSKNLVIAECGATMYQPRFSPYDTVTMTTNPFVMKKAKEIVEILLKRKVNLVIPYENMTKSEVIISSPYKEFFKDSHSCISLRFGKNEGTCYGCVVRNLGFLVAGVEDTAYTHDPIGNPKYDVDNLSSLLSFSEDVLFNYENMPDYSKNNIANYNKKDLFKRFAIDNFAALHAYKNERGELNSYIQPIYKNALKKLGEEKFIKRIEKVRNNTFKPNFNKFV